MILNIEESNMENFSAFRNNCSINELFIVSVRISDFDHVCFLRSIFVGIWPCQAFLSSYVTSYFLFVKRFKNSQKLCRFWIYWTKILIMRSQFQLITIRSKMHRLVRYFTEHAQSDRNCNSVVTVKQWPAKPKAVVVLRSKISFGNHIAETANRISKVWKRFLITFDLKTTLTFQLVDSGFSSKQMIFGRTKSLKVLVGYS